MINIIIYLYSIHIFIFCISLYTCMALDYTKKARKHSQIKAVGALVCLKLRKSQTFSILQQNSPDTLLQS